MESAIRRTLHLLEVGIRLEGMVGLLRDSKHEFAGVLDILDDGNDLVKDEASSSVGTLCCGTEGGTPGTLGTSGRSGNDLGAGGL